MLKAEPPSNKIPWTDIKELNHHYLTKTFKFNNQNNLGNFVIELIQIEHSVGEPRVEAVEIPHILSIKVCLEFSNSNSCAAKMIKHIESLFVGCTNGKNRSFWNQ